MRTVKLKDFIKEAETLYGKDAKKWKFICPMCDTIQSAEDLIAAGVDKAKVKNYIGFSCIGRWTGAGSHLKSKGKGNGCDWTLGGFFLAHTLVIENAEGKKQASFELYKDNTKEKLR